MTLPSNGSLKCDICSDLPATHIAVNPHAPTVKDDYGVGRTTLFLCRMCACGAVGASLVALGIAVMEIMVK